MEVRLAAVKGIRRYLSGEEVETPAKQTIDLDILGPLVASLPYDEEPMPQFQTAWVLTNIAPAASEMLLEIP